MLGVLAATSVMADILGDTAAPTFVKGGLHQEHGFAPPRLVTDLRADMAACNRRTPHTPQAQKCYEHPYSNLPFL